MRKVHALILCLMIALLPLRGMAHGWMTTAAANPHGMATATGDRMPVMGATAHVAPAAKRSAVASHPCHGGMDAGSQPTSAALAHGAPSATPDAGPVDGGAKPLAGHACSLCDLCHATLASMAAPLLLPDALPGDRPAARQTGRMPQGTASGIYRPPRTQA